MPPRLADHHVALGVFVALLAAVTVLGFVAARWRRPDTPPDLEQWGLGGRAFGNWVTWFLLGGDIYTAYTFVALPALIYGAGAAGFFAIPFAVVVYPLVLPLVGRMWSVCHRHGFVTPAEFVRARFDSRALSTAVAVLGIVATLPYLALQLIGFEAVLTVLGLPSGWPLTVAFAVLAAFTFRSGLRAPALLSIVKDILLLWTVLALIIGVAMTARGWHGVFTDAARHFDATPNPGDGLLLAPTQQIGYLTLVVGSALGLFLYPHVLTGLLAARNRRTVRRNIAALPVYTLVLGVLALLGFVAISAEIKPVGGDRNTVVPALFDAVFPGWCAGLAFAAIGIGALVPAGIMSIAAANLFTRSIYREYLRPGGSAAEEIRIGKWASLLVKAGAVLAILLLDPQFSIDLQLIGGVVILQILPAVVIGLYSRWPHRGALLAGLASGLAVGMFMLYQVQQVGPDGRVLRAHFGGPSWPLANLGLDTRHTVYVGMVAVLVNLAVTMLGTLVLRGFRIPAGTDRTRPVDYLADEDGAIERMTELVDGICMRRPAHLG